jgi:COMPASS component SWD2
MNPGADNFLSCGEDDTVRLWDTNTQNCCGKLLLHRPYLAAWDPSANVIAIASEAAQTILLYDFRNYDKEPFAAFDMLEKSNRLQANSMNRNWNKLEFSNDGKSLLVGTSGHTLFVLDAFDGNVKAALRREHGGPNRLAAGEHRDGSAEALFETSGNACFSPDGRYVLGGSRKENVLVWDTLQLSDANALKPIHQLEMKAEAAVLAYNPRYNFFASADKELVFWVPDPSVQS